MDTKRSIRKVSFKTWEKKMFLGLRLIDENGDCIVDETWDNYGKDVEWITQSIPDKQEIIGL